MEEDDATARARAGFAASAVARLARALREQGVIDDFVIGELAEVARSSAEEAGGTAAAKAMAIVQAQLGAPGIVAGTLMETGDEAGDGGAP